MSEEGYFERIEADLDAAIERAERARDRGGDPETAVEIPVAQDMADRVENILGIPGVAERVRELEGEFSREEAALELAADFAAGRVGEYESTAGKVEGAVRTAVALLTEGVVAAPIEGIDRVELAENDDGTECVRVFYAGPIRSAGGTAQALSVLVADYTRSLLDVEAYQPRTPEVERYAEEVALYDRETGLQYSPKDEETKFIARNCPVLLDGEATGQEEVSGYRDLERVPTNAARGGMCLVLAEGIAQKAPKIQRYTDDLEEVSWPWLADLIDGSLGGGDDGDEDAEADPEEPADDDAAGPPRVDPTGKFLRDLIAGRPVFGHPSAAGGFRLRYGRARNHGFATAGVHPATMHIVEDFLAAGTQLKTEHPGKAAGVVPVDTIEGPTVRLATGEVRRIDDPEEARELRNGVEAIIDLGEYLVNYGEFVENNHPLAPASYTVEWWSQEMDDAGVDVRALRDSPHVDLAEPTAEQALAWATDHDAPLHPAYTYLWHDVSVEQFERLADAVAAGELGRAHADGGTRAESTRAADAGDVLVLADDEEVRATLEALLVEHTRTRDEAVEIGDWRPLARSLGVSEELTREWETLPRAAREHGDGGNAVAAVNAVAPFTVRERAPTRVGCRMGRPEKSEQRELSPAVHTLFPIGDAGGDQRDLAAAAGHAEGMQDAPGQIEVSLGERACPACGEHTFRTRCPDCGSHTEPHYECGDCEVVCEPDESGRVRCPRCDREVTAARPWELDLHSTYREALDAVGEREAAFDILKGVKGLTSADKVPEPIEKGVLRAKHGVSAFKDGTVRYDMTDLPVTAVRPSELDVTADALRSLGYEADVHGEPLRHDDQLVHLKVQDVVLSEGAADHLLSTADFVDDLLENYYGLERFYDAEERADLVGELVFGLAPHTSAAVVGRVVGFTSAAVGYAHPYFHAAKRRNCFHPETKLWYEDEAGAWHHDDVETFVEGRLDPETAEEDDFGALVQELDGDVYVPSISETGAETLQRVDAVSKHPAVDHMVRVETRGGRDVTVTPDHSMRRWKEGGVERVEARNLAAGDFLPTPKRVDVEGETTTFDLLAEFLDADAIPADDLMIRGIGTTGLKSLLDAATDADNYLAPVAERLDVSQSTVYNWVSRDSIPASVLLEFFDRETVLDRVPADVTLGVRRDTAAVSRHLDVDGAVGALLGYYAAEGFTRRESGSFYQTTICIPDDVPRRRLQSTFEDALHVEAFEENEWKLTVSSRLVATLFADVLDAGCRAESKCIPDCVLSAPDAVLRQFLAAYFSGDGSASSDRVEVRAHTVSDDLKTDLVAALKRFGVASTVYREERTPRSGAVAEFYDDTAPTFETWVLNVTSENAVRFADRVGFDLDRKTSAMEGALERVGTRPQRLFGDGGDVWLDEVDTVEVVPADVDSTYSMTVEETNALVANDLYVGQCDGDEDCVMLLMDGLLNFSKSYLPDKRGGRMDAPLVMTSRIDPTEIDDEAHNVDVVPEYPLEFYEATRRMADPGEVDIAIAEDTLGTDAQYDGFAFTHDTSDIAGGPDLSAYKTLESMTEKMDAQLELARTLRAVDETDVAERVIEYHFLPDLIGNLRAFARQETRCLGCGTKYRRVPLSGECRECGGDVTLTVHEGSVSKYMDTAIEVAETYGCREYTKQRLDILERSIESLFQNDRNKPTSLGDFM
jgi:DNA polymerase II large subunit